MASTVPVCGIDLGTTTSAAALYLPATKDRKAETVMLRLGKTGDTIPSVVCRSPSTLIWKAGENAIAEADKDRTKTPIITRAKRLVGLQYTEVQQAVLDHMPLVKDGKGDLKGRPVFVMGDVEISPEAAGAEVLKEIMRLADNKLSKHGVDKKKVMVTIPAYFDTRQVEAMHHMMKLAGLETYTEGFAREPTAALASWYEEEDNAEKFSWFIVFDLGGGTLDISIVYQEQKYKFIVAGKAGDMFLGGEDFDDVLKELVLVSFRMIHTGATEPSPAKASELQKLCKQAKELFQDDETTDVQTITVDAYCRSPSGESLTLSEDISRDAYNSAVSPLVKRCMDKVEEAMKITEDATRLGSEARSTCPPFDRSKVDKVLMVGGSSRMLPVQSSLRAIFGDKVEVLEKPELAVAKGAAVMASMSEAKVSGQNANNIYAMSIVESVPIGIGFEVHDVTTDRRHMKIVLPAGTPFGRTKTNDDCFVHTGDFTFSVLQGNRDDYDGLGECHVVKVFHIKQPEWSSQRRRIYLHIEFHITMDGGLRVRISSADRKHMERLDVQQDDLNSRNEQARKELEQRGHRHIEEQGRLRAIERLYQLLMADYKALTRVIGIEGESSLSGTMRLELASVRAFVLESHSCKVADMRKEELEVRSETIKDLIREVGKRKRDTDEEDSESDESHLGEEGEEEEGGSGSEDEVDVE